MNVRCEYTVRDNPVQTMRYIDVLVNLAKEEDLGSGSVTHNGFGLIYSNSNC